MDSATLDKDYGSLIVFAKAKMKGYHIGAEPEDLVHAAFDKFYDQQELYSKGFLQKLITDELFKEVEHSRRIKGDVYRNVPIETSVCIGCKEDKPVAAFHVSYSTGAPVIWARCKPCRAKQEAERYKRIYVKKGYKKGPGAKVYSKQEAKELQEQGLRVTKPKTGNEDHIKGLWKKANQKYIEKQKLLLTDVYIKSLIKKQFPFPTAQQIHDKREQIKNLKIDEVFKNEFELLDEPNSKELFKYSPIDFK